jgi:hypothetical protein
MNNAWKQMQKIVWIKTKIPVHVAFQARYGSVYGESHKSRYF